MIDVQFQDKEKQRLAYKYFIRAQIASIFCAQLSSSIENYCVSGGLGQQQNIIGLSIVINNKSGIHLMLISINDI